MRVRSVGVAAIFIAIVAAITSIQFSGKRTSKEQPPLINLQPQTLDQLRREFNAASDRVRIILLLSPT